MDRRVLQAVGLLFVVGYLGVLAFHGPTRSPERFPVFNWSLFSRIPDPSVTDYGIRLTSVDGVPLDEPVYYEDAVGLVDRPGAPEAYQTIQRYGRATEAGQILRIASSKDQLDATWLADLTVAEYELVKREFELLDRDEGYRSETVLDEGSIER